jgi:hypothetical protein
MRKMKILYLEDNHMAIENIVNVNTDLNERFDIDFVNTIVACDELLFGIDQQTYSAIILDLCIEMPQLTKADISAIIPELNRDDVPTYCHANNIALYGLDYFKYVMAKNERTKTLIDQGQVIFFTGHAVKIVNSGLYSVKMDIYKNVSLFDRAEKGATKALFAKLEDIDNTLRKS